MKVIVKDNYEALGQTAASILLGKMTEDRRVNIAITAGSTPKSTYETLIPWVKGEAAYESVHYYNFDEVVNRGETRGITITALEEQFFRPARIAADRIHVLTPENYQQHDEAIAAAGGLDAMLIGIGADGHFCANMPMSTVFTKHTHEVRIRQEYPWYEWAKAEANDKLPDSLVTMGPAAIMKVKHLVLIANGEHKAAILKTALTGAIDPNIPASILQLHPNLTVITDKAAAAEL